MARRRHAFIASATAALCWAFPITTRQGDVSTLLAAASQASVLQTPAFTAPVYLKAPAPIDGDLFGRAVAVSGNTAVVGAPQDDAANPQVIAGRTGAAYVYERTDGEWKLQATLTASNAGAGDQFGFAVAISGNTIVVGALFEDGSGLGVNPSPNDSLTNAGAAYVFVRTGTTWSQQAYLKSANLKAGAYFGRSVGISGDTIIAGAPSDTGGGSVFVFVRGGDAWYFQTTLTSSNRVLNDGFGGEVSLSGDTAVVGAANKDATGAAYVFVRNGTVWTEQAYLKGSNTELYDVFGGAVAISGDTLVVGARGECGSGIGVNPPQNNDTLNAGAAYVFVRFGSTWIQTDYLKASNTDFADGFGWSVAISGDFIVVGAINEDGRGTGVDPVANKAAPTAGAAYVFERSGSTWTSRTYLKSARGLSGEWFGSSVAVSEQTVVVGAERGPGRAAGVNPAPATDTDRTGAAYLFDLAVIPNAPSSAAQMDLNGDGGGDAFLYDSTTGHWSRQQSQSGGGFVEQGTGGWLPGWTALPANFDGNNLTDLFLFNAVTGAWSKMINDGPGRNFIPQSQGTWWPGWQRFVMDLDGDNLSDLFLYDPATGQWFKCISTWATPSGFSYSQGQWSPGWEVTPLSLDADQLGDLFLIDRTTGRWFWVLGQAGPDFLYPRTATWYPTWQFTVGDFNGDRRSDLLLHDPPSGQFFVAMNSGAGFTYTSGYWSQGWTVAAADLDADGKDDLFLHHPASGHWFQMIGDGAGNFANAGGEIWSAGWRQFRTDLDGDGRADLVLYDPTTGVWYQARNLVSGSFTYHSGSWSPGWSLVTRAAGR